MIADAHTHNQSSCEGIISTSPERFNPLPGKVYSVGLHPWLTAGIADHNMEQLRRILKFPEVVAVGETGIDKMKGAPIEIQEKIFLQHIELSEETKKPLIIHEVKAAGQILAIHRQIKPKMPWIRHGFRGNAQTARMYYSKGIYLSIGEKFNPEAVKSIPESLLLLETDESPLTITEIARKAATARQTTTEALLALSASNISTILKLSDSTI